MKKSDWMNVTPSLAREWLKFNTENRPFRRNVADGYKAAFQRGEYLATHQGVAFDVNGRLLDGQHRLTAISEMPDDFVVEMLVTTGLPTPAFKVIDQGLKRTHSDVLSIPQGLAAVARFAAVLTEHKKSSVTPIMLVPYVNGLKPAYDRLVEYAPMAQKTWSSAAVRTAAILRMLGGGDADYVMLSYHALLHSEYDSMSPIIQTLHRQQVGGKVRGSTELFLRSYRAFDVGRARLDTLQISDPSKIWAEARDVVNTHVLGQRKLPIHTAPKKPAVSKYTGRSKAIEARAARGFE